VHNIEFKAELRDLEGARRQCRVLKAQRIGHLRQSDVYFRMPDGRLKRRTAPGEPIEWIYYHRPDRVSPKMSTFTILSEEQALRRWGTGSLRTWLTVTKTRELWMLGPVRIHLDEVDGLGRFIEFEAVVSPEHEVRECHARVQRLRQVFGPVLGEPVAVSYCDLLEQAQGLPEE
jgi:adenylate cyclase class IV